MVNAQPHRLTAERHIARSRGDEREGDERREEEANECRILHDKSSPSRVSPMEARVPRGGRRRVASRPNGV